MVCPHCNISWKTWGRCPVCGRRGAEPSAYYTREFRRLAAGERPSFNVAALLGGPVHLLYRGCFRRFFALYFPYLLTRGLLAAACAMAGLPLYRNWLQTGTWGAPGALLTIAWLLWQLCGLWGLALAIYNGNTFNAALYRKLHGCPAPRSHLLAPLALVTAALALAAALTLPYGRWALAARRDAVPWPDAPYAAPWDAPATHPLTVPITAL